MKRIMKPLRCMMRVKKIQEMGRRDHDIRNQDLWSKETKGGRVFPFVLQRGTPFRGTLFTGDTARLCMLGYWRPVEGDRPLMVRWFSESRWLPSLRRLLVTQQFWCAPQSGRLHPTLSRRRIISTVRERDRGRLAGLIYLFWNFYISARL